MFTSEYERRLEAAVEQLEKTKAEIDFLKLQIKQEKQQARWAKGSPIIKDMVKRYPGLKVENGAGCTYLTLDVPCYKEFEAPFGWEKRDSYSHSAMLGSPVTHTYRLRNCPAELYVIRRVH